MTDTSAGATQSSADVTGTGVEVTGTGGDVGEPPSDWPEQLAFSPFDGQGGGVRILDFDSGEVVEVPPLGERCLFLDWSPDGRYMLFYCDDTLYIAWGDGRQTRPIFEGRTLDGSWSPDGNQLAVYAAVEGPPYDYELWLIDVETGESTPLTSGVDDLDELWWSPDSGSLVMRRDVSSFGYAIQTVDADTGDFALLFQDTDAGVFTRGMSVSYAGPSAGFIAYPAEEGGQTRVSIMDLSGENMAVISSTTDVSSDLPAFSPDGTRIVWSEIRVSDSYLILANADGSDQRRIDADTAGEPLQWSPDQTRLAVRAEGSSSQLLVIDLESGGSGRIDVAVGPVRPRWRPAAPG